MLQRHRGRGNDVDLMSALMYSLTYRWNVGALITILVGVGRMGGWVLWLEFLGVEARLRCRCSVHHRGR